MAIGFEFGGHDGPFQEFPIIPGGVYTGGEFTCICCQVVQCFQACADLGLVEQAPRAGEAQMVDDRFDPVSYKTQLLSALGESASLAEKHNRDLVPFFLSLADPPTKLPRQQLSAWLTVFDKFTNPKALRSTEVLHSMYMTLLAHPDRSLQRLAFSCILTYKSPNLTPHADKLRLLLDETKWRDELTTLDLQEIDPEHRSEFVNVVIKILFGMMLEKRGRTRGADRRAAVAAAH